MTFSVRQDVSGQNFCKVFVFLIWFFLVLQIKIAGKGFVIRVFALNGKSCFGTHYRLTGGAWLVPFRFSVFLPPTVTLGAFIISIWLTRLTLFFVIIRVYFFTFGFIFIAAFTWPFCVFTFTFFTLLWTKGSLFMSWRWPWIRQVVCSTFLSAFIQPFKVTCTWVWFRFLVYCLWVRPICCFI
jgi:hypothetical protein